jgi:hypothetical protein
MAYARDIEPIRVKLMREGEFSGLPSSVQLVHIRDGNGRRSHNEPKLACEPTLSASLIKRSPVRSAD